MADVRLYEAIVVNGVPDPNLPGHIEVKIPEMFRDEVVPYLIPPLYPGASFGGWQSVPQATDPTDPDAEVRVTVMHMGRNSFRWVGTTQVFSAIGGDPANRVGARSKDNRHSIFLDSLLGVFISAGSDQNDGDAGPTNYIAMDPTDDSITINTVGGGMVQVKASLVNLMDGSGNFVQMSSASGGQVLLSHSAGVANLSLRSGDVAALSATTVQINGGSIELGGGVLAPTHAYLLTSTHFTDWIAWLSALDTFMAAVALDTIDSPATAAAAVAFIASQPAGVFHGKHTTSLSAGAPYLSARTFGD
jgi:hypothetical protein